MADYLDTEIIYDKNGNPMPQHLDAGDKTAGADGTMKAKKTDDVQEVEGTLDVGNHPTDYPNSASLVELQAIKADIATTKQTQTDILNKLNGTLDTQLTGSNVAIKNVFNKLVITDSVTVNSSPFAANDCSSFYLEVMSSLDEDVNVFLSVENGNTFYNNGGTLLKYTVKGKVFNGGIKSVIVSPTDLPPLNFPFVGKAILRVQCPIAPSSGSLTIHVHKKMR